MVNAPTPVLGQHRSSTIGVGGLPEQHPDKEKGHTKVFGELGSHCALVKRLEGVNHKGLRVSHDTLDNRQAVCLEELRHSHESWLR